MYPNHNKTPTNRGSGVGAVIGYTLSLTHYSCECQLNQRNKKTFLKKREKFYEHLEYTSPFLNKPKIPTTDNNNQPINPLVYSS